MRELPVEQIRRTLILYAMYYDDGRLEDWARLFTDDAEFRAAGRTISGRDAIRSYVDEVREPGRQVMHLTGSPLVIEDGFGGRARAWSDFVVFEPDRAIRQIGRYHDLLTREGDDRWRFRLREIVLPGRLPELASPVPA